nr:MAG TPA: hypothetical protein [Caudoviricetes sp.]
MQHYACHNALLLLQHSHQRTFVCLICSHFGAIIHPSNDDLINEANGGKSLFQILLHDVGRRIGFNA